MMTVEFPSSSETEARLVAARHAVGRRVRRHRRLRAGAAIGAALLVAGSGVGATLVVQQISQQEAATSIVCFAHDDLGSLSGTVGMATPVPSPGVASPTQEPVDKADLCRLVWNSGLAVAASNGGHWPDVDPNVPDNFTTPDLAFCLLRTGQTGGFPIEAPATTAVQVCDSLGLPVDGSAPAA